MIRKVEFQNFKALRDTSTTLERFTVIVGPNACGKSSLLQGLECLCVEGGSISRQAYESYRTHGVDDDFTIRAETDRGDAVVSGNSRIWRDPASRPTVAMLHLEATHLRQVAVSNDKQPALGPTGSGLHSTLAYLALNQPESFRLLQDTLRTIIPSIRRLRFERIQPQFGGVLADSLLLDTTSGNGIPAAHVSEGTLLVLGILAVVYHECRPQLLLLDDLDRGLHPRAQLDLVEFLQGLLKREPELQIVTTTHSPYVLDRVRNEEVRLMTLDDSGSAHIGSILDHPEFERWKSEMTPGEFWMMFGEKWLTTPVAS